MTEAKHPALQIAMDKLSAIESSGDPMAFNKRTKARGLFQITPIVLKEWNNFNKKSPYTIDQLFDPTVNRSIADWYLHQRIPQMLTSYKLPVTEDNVLTSYNAGIGTLTEKKPLPLETQNYIKKYRGEI